MNEASAVALYPVGGNPIASGDDEPMERATDPSLTIAEALREGANRLAAAGIDHPRLESRILLAQALGCSSEDLIRDLTVRPGRSDFGALIARRAAREPLAFILGWREFWSLRFRVSPATLIPRPETETVVEAALSVAPDRDAPMRVLDLGTGTGCLLLAFLNERPCAFGVGTDRSLDAVRLAQGNARDLGLGSRSAFVLGDWADSVGGRFDLVLSNPPYIPASDLAGLMPEVVGHEPRSALDGGESGLAAYRTIIAALPGILRPSGAAVLELGIGQSEAVAAIAASAGLRAETRLDLSGTPRAMILRPSP